MSLQVNILQVLEIARSHNRNRSSCWLQYLGKGVRSPIGIKTIVVFESANCKSKRHWQVGSLQRQVAFFFLVGYNFIISEDSSNIEYSESALKHMTI